jgi:hypothetical protein
MVKCHPYTPDLYFFIELLVIRRIKCLGKVVNCTGTDL